MIQFLYNITNILNGNVNEMIKDSTMREYIFLLFEEDGITTV